MTLRSFLGLVRDRWKLIVVVTLLAGAVSVGLTKRTAPVYSSSVTFVVSAPDDLSNVIQAYQANLLSQQKVEMYANLLTSPMLAKSVVEEARLPIPASVVQAGISAHVVPQTVLLRATVTSDSAARAHRIARTISVIFPRQIGELERPAKDATPPVSIRVVGQPSYSSVPVSPKPVRNLFAGLGLGLLAGLTLACAARSLDTSLKTIDQLGKSLGGKPVLGVIPYDREARSHPVPMGAQLGGVRMEAFRKLRVNFEFMQVDRSRKVFMFTSALPDDGKSTTVCNLAVALSPGGTRVIIVECDMRRPQAGRYLGLPGGAGLTDALLGRAELDDLIRTGAADAVDILTSGTLPPDPADLLGSRRMAELIEELRSRYDVVLLDMPPTLAFADATAVGRYCDGAIVVARYGKTRAEQVRQVTESLTSVGTPVLAGVFSMAPPRLVAGSGNYYAYQRRRFGLRIGRAPLLPRARAGAQALSGGAPAGKGPRS